MFAVDANLPWSAKFATGASCLYLRGSRTERARRIDSSRERASQTSEKSPSVSSDHILTKRISLDNNKRYNFDRRERSHSRDKPTRASLLSTQLTDVACRVRMVVRHAARRDSLHSSFPSRTQSPATNQVRRPTRRPTNRAPAAHAPARFTRQRRVNEDLRAVSIPTYGYRYIRWW